MKIKIISRQRNIKRKGTKMKEINQNIQTFSRYIKKCIDTNTCPKNVSDINTDTWRVKNIEINTDTFRYRYRNFRYFYG